MCGALQDLAGVSNGSTLVPALAVQLWVMLRQVLSHPASISSQQVLPMNPSEPGSPARRALLPDPYLLPGWSCMWSHAPKNPQHQGTTVTLSSSVPCHGSGHCAPLPPYIPSVPENVATPTLSVSIIPHAKQISTYTFFLLC